MNFFALLVAELRKVRGRGLLAAVHLFAAVHGLLAVGLCWGLQWASRKVGGEGIVDALDLTVPAEVALDLVHLPLMTLVLLAYTAVLFAEDFSLGTMAVVAGRGARRESILFAKWAVATGTAFTTAAIAVLPAFLFGAVLFGLDGDLKQLAGNPGVGWMGEVDGLWTRAGRVALGVPLHMVAALPAIALSALIAGVTRSMLFTLFAAVLLLVGDAGLGLALGLWGQTEFQGAEAAKALEPWTIRASGRFFDGHEGGWRGVVEHIEAFARTVAWSAILLVLAVPVWSRRDLH